MRLFYNVQGNTSLECLFRFDRFKDTRESILGFVDFFRCSIKELIARGAQHDMISVSFDAICMIRHLNRGWNADIAPLGRAPESLNWSDAAAIEPPLHLQFECVTILLIFLYDDNNY